MIVNLRLCAIVSFALLISNCANMNESNRIDTMNNSSAKFFDIQMNTQEQNECSPAARLPGWKGILINAPSLIDASKSALPICGYYKLKIADIVDSEPLTVHVYEINSERVYTGLLVDIDENPMEPEPGQTDDDMAQFGNMAVGSYFNHNLLDYVEMPFVTGIYEISVEFAGQKSNVVTINVTQ